MLPERFYQKNPKKQKELRTFNKYGQRRYFLIRFAQTKIPYLFSSTSG